MHSKIDFSLTCNTPCRRLWRKSCIPDVIYNHLGCDVNRAYLMWHHVTMSTCQPYKLLNVTQLSRMQCDNHCQPNNTGHAQITMIVSALDSVVNKVQQYLVTQQTPRWRCSSLCCLQTWRNCNKNSRFHNKVHLHSFREVKGLMHFRPVNNKLTLLESIYHLVK